MRLKQLLDPAEESPERIMCNPEVSSPNVWLKEDTFNSEFHSKRDKLNVAGYSQYIDLLFCYAAIRKGRGEKDSYTLEAILTEEIGEGKIELDGDIRTALHKNFERFFIYSIMDSFRLMQQENQNKDIDLLFNLSQITVTKFERALTKTISLRNFAAKILLDEGYILSNNKNRNNRTNEKKKFRGALVANPSLLRKVGISILGLLSNKIFDNVVDEDLTAMYPSIILSGCIDMSTMIGKIVDGEDDTYGEILFDLLAEGDVSRLANHILGLPTSEDILNNLEEYLS